MDATIYMEVPIGCTVTEGDYVCLLLKNLYSLKQAAKTWYEHLRDTLVLDEVKARYDFEQCKCQHHPNADPIYNRCVRVPVCLSVHLHSSVSIQSCLVLEYGTI